MKEYKLYISFRESDVSDWGTPEGLEWDDILKKEAEGLHDDCTLYEVKSYALGEIFPKFDEKLMIIIKNVTKDTNLYQGNDVYSGGYDTIYGYTYDLDNNISEETLNNLRDKLADELTSVHEICVKEIED